jgi:toxin ParE1/3/4
MKFKLRFSQSVILDMENVLAHTLDQFGEKKHEQYKSLIRQALMDIAADPLRFPAKHRPELHRDARTFHIARRGKRARHFFLYRVSGNEFIEIARLLHDAFDLKRNLPEGFEGSE